MSDEPVQLFVRTDKGATFGPLSPTSIELLIDNGVVVGRVQVSFDGTNFVFPGRVPGVRMVFPRALWGDVIEPGDELDAQWSKVALPPTVGPPASSGSGIRSGPSGVMSAPSGIRAGPGAVAAQASRPSGMYSAPSGAAPLQKASTPSGIRAGPGAVSAAASRSPGSMASGIRAAPAPAAGRSSPSAIAPPPSVSSPSSADVRSATPYDIVVGESVILAPPPPTISPSAIRSAPAEHSYSPSVIITPGVTEVDADDAPAPSAEDLMMLAPDDVVVAESAAPAEPTADDLMLLAPDDVVVAEAAAPPAVLAPAPPAPRPAIIAPPAPAVLAPSPPAPRPAIIAPPAPPAAKVVTAPAPPTRAEPTSPAAVRDDAASEFSELKTDPGLILERGVSAEPAPLIPDDIPPTGSLGALGPIRLYFLAAATDRTGLLTVELGDRTLHIHFRKGTPEFVDSTHAEDGLSLFLVKRGLLTAETLSQADSQRARFGGELLPALFASGLLNPNTSFQHLAQRSVDLIYRVLVAEQGTFTWESVELSPNKAMPIGHKWSILIEQLRRVPASEVRRRMYGALDLPVMKGQGPVPVGDLRLSPQETRALNHFDGVRSLNQLASQLPGETDTMFRTAWVLQYCDTVSFAAVKVKSSTPPAPVKSSGTPAPSPLPPISRPQPVPGPPAAAAPKPRAPPPVLQAPPGGPPKLAPIGPTPAPQPSNPAPAYTSRPSQVSVASPKAPAPGPGYGARPSQVLAQPKPSTPTPAGPLPVATDDVKFLTNTLETMRAQDFFQVLGVSRDADNSLIKIAYFKLAKIYHPDTVPVGTAENIVKLKAEIFERVGNAHRTLSDAKTRVDYIGELAAGGTGEKVDVLKILAGEEYFQKGVILVKARKFVEAVKMLSDAIAASDTEGEYYAWRGWAKFFTFTDKKEGQAEAMKDIAICLKKSPNVAMAYYAQGFMAKVLGDLVAAKTHFTKTVQLDPKHIDAQRELRMTK